DFIQFTNYSSEPLFYICEYFQFSDEWVPAIKYYNNFNSDDLLFAQNIDSWDGTDYAGDGRMEYTYNIDNSISTIFTLDYSGGDYDSLYKRKYNYSAGKLVNITSQYYTTEWENDGIEIYSYNSDGLIETTTFQYWTGSTWADSYRIISNYDEDGNLIEEINQDYAPGWETTGRLVYSYDTNGFLNEVLTQLYDGVDYLDYQKNVFVEFENRMPATNTISYWDGFVWNLSLKATMEYEAYDDGTVDLNDVNVNPDLNIYPNPASENIAVEFYSSAISLTTFIITNASGEIVNTQSLKSVPGKNLITKAITGLPSGIYNLSLIQNGRKETSSFIVQ
ncbi:MAG TPA: T9SS type A sorting domain-containing protein, partial [Chitinophagales bacterium]|nr:T9SS type A sorting domain-containing protein [Chitinophagales bacterium]